MQGYRGKLLVVNLNSGEIAEQSLDEELARQFIGGSGLGVRLLYNKIDAQTDPLGAENPLMFLTGPFAGTNVPTGSKMTVCAKSPLT
ncbi:MAG: aldehyde ferredoxin oxidoreductase N-terminal domain-containing protein, partial [Candidatus Thorarchaeota archaeon]